MSTEPHARIAAAVRAIADAPPVTAPPPEALRTRRATRARPAGWAAPALAAAAVLALAAAVALLPARGTPGREPASARPPASATLPAEFAGMSLLTAAVSDAPPGPAIALYGQGSIETRRLGTSQVIVVGADGRTYRRLDHAERSGIQWADGEWAAAPRRLSPDGTRVAVGDHRDAEHRIEVVDLVTGGVTTHELKPSGAAYPVSWSPDGRRLLVATSAGPPEQPSTGRLYVLDLDSATSTPLGETTGGPWGGAFSPDGTRVAAQAVEPRQVEVFDAAGTVLLRMPLDPKLSLSDGQSWSPDGRLLVLGETGADGYGLAFLDATGTGRAVPAPISVGGDYPPDLLGWRTPDTMLIGRDDDGGYEIAELSVHGGEPRVLSRISDGPGGLARVSRIQLAADLVATAQVRDVGGADRGPWPRWWRITLGALVLLGALVAWRVIRRRRLAEAPD